MTTFRYVKESVGVLREKVLRPKALLYISKDGKDWRNFEPYIDSGADVTLFPLSIGKAIGLEVDKRKIKSLGGVGGGLKVIYTNIFIKIADKEFKARVAWSMSENTPQLLGRADIFNKFKITFDEKKEEIIFD